MAAHMKRLTRQQERLVDTLLRSATDEQANTLDDLMVAAGYWWRCGGGADSAFHGYFTADSCCDVCGCRAFATSNGGGV